MALTSGTRLGTYTVTSLIGAGGMGEVYQARDSTLDRDVAIKVLPEQFARDSERLARFQREAKMLASLNHPNIAAIYGFEQAGGMHYLVMEMVPGQTLQERVAGGRAVPLAESLEIAKQIAEALEAAHNSEKGIIHRDLKPANVKVTPEGRVKVLDFGLAKAFTAEPTQEEIGNSPTLSMAATVHGVILGTAAYMSPEQARGKAVTKATDIWAFGAVLFELLTGKQAFEGNDVSDILAAVIRAEPNWSLLPAATPPSIRLLLRRCLRKERRQRLQDATDARIEIEDGLAWILDGGLQAGVAVPVAPQPKSRERMAWAAAAVGFVAALALALALIHSWRAAEDIRVLKVSVLTPEKTSFQPRSMPAVSPDGRRVAFVATTDGKDLLWVRDLDSLAAHALTGTEGAAEPFWSPDSRFVGFFASGKLKKIDVTGGPALSLCDATSGQQGYGGSWSKGDVIVFSPSNSGGLFRVPAAGGSATPATTPESGEVNHRFPWFLPDGRHFLYLERNSDAEKDAIYAGDLDSKIRSRIVAASSNGVYTPGQLLFVRGGTLMAQPFDAQKLQTTGDPVPVAEQVPSNGGGVFAQGLFSASQSGVLAYISGSAGTGAQLVLFDRSGKAVGTVGVPIAAPVYWGAISPDGNSVAEDHPDPQTGVYDLWLHDLARGTASRLTFNSKTNRFPVWSPDGSHIAFGSVEGHFNLYQKDISGIAPDEALDKDGRNKRPDDWSRDGRYIIEEASGDPKTGTDIWVLPLFGDRKPFPYLQTQFNEHHAKVSPDGHWLAYVSDETKRDEIYVQTFPTPGGKWQVSTNGGGFPVWSKDGKELFFVGADQKLMAVEVKNNAVNGGPRFEAAVPKPLFDTRLAIGTNSCFDVGKDGRFLIPTPPEQAGSVAMTVVVNWTAGLKK